MPYAVVLDMATYPAASRLTMRDRMELACWSETAQARGGERLVLHERVEGDASEVGNYVAVYAAGNRWASWGLSRRQGGIVVWDSITGHDAGRFASMHEALSWLLDRRPGAACRSAGDLTPALSRNSCGRGS